MRNFNVIAMMLLLSLTAFIVADTNTKLNLENVLTDDSPVVRLRHPAISPDGTKLAFSAQGNIWVANVDGSDVRRVSAHPAREIKPIWMPNSKELLYIANYADNYDIFRISIEGGMPTRLTSYHTSEYVSEVTPDGKYVFYYGSRETRSDIFMTSTEKLTTPVRLMHSYKESESSPTVTTDMKHVAFEMSGASIGYRRPAYSGYGDSEIWMADFDSGELSNYRKLTDNMFADSAPKFVWHPKKQRNVLLYSSYPTKNQKILGNNGIFMIDPLNDAPDALTPKLIIPSPISRFPLRSTNVVFLKDMWHIAIENGIGGINYYVVNPETMTIASEKTLKIDVNPLQVKFLQERVIKSDSITDFSIAPDNRKVAVIHNGDVFVGSSLSGGFTERFTFTPNREFHPCWSKDSRTVYFVTLMNGNADIYSADIKTGKLTPVIATEHQEMMPTLTPDGKNMLYIRNDNELRKRNMKTGEEVLIFSGGIFERQGLTDEPKYRISPTGRFVLFTPKMANDLNANIWVASLDSKITSRQLTFFKSNTYNPCWSPDEMNIIFTTYIDHDWDLYTLNFDEKPLAGYSEDGLDSLLGRIIKSSTIEEEKKKKQAQTQPKTPQTKQNQTKPKKPVVKKPVVTSVLSDADAKKWRAEFDKAWEKMTQVSTAPTDEWNPIIVKSGTVKKVIYKIDNQFWTCSINGAGHRKLAVIPGSKDSPWLSPDSRYICFRNAGRINKFDHKTNRNSAISMRFDYIIDPIKQRLGIYDEAVWVFENYYYSSEKIREWMPAAKFYRRMIDGNSNDNEISSIYSELLGSLNSSHTGYYGKSYSRTSDTTGEFGIFFNPRVLFEQGKFLIEDIIEDTDTLKVGIKPGMYLLAVDGTELTRDVCLDTLLRWKLGKRVFLTLSEKPNPAEHEKFTVKLRGQSRMSMWYKQKDNWLKRCKENTDTLSDNEFGYIHIAGMNSAGVLKLKRELNSFTNKKGFVLDMRGNTGGYTARDILEILYKKPFIMRSVRTFGRISENIYRGYSYEKPVVLITNENSVSNAEIFSEGFQRLGIGPVIGMPTTGGVIGTSSYRLSDGTSIRLPGYGCYTVDGVDLEGNPRMPDVLVDREYYTAVETDVQLVSAVRELRKQVLYYGIHKKRPYNVASRNVIEPELEKLYAEWVARKKSSGKAE
ncbi:MAG: hypothetical protein K8S87_09540 [Planctomycetes bacterium]|nr:hypothetical protein [Planctomycetota bacterium]